METTRHFTATLYVVHRGETVLHEHPHLDLWLPPGGHLQRDELPHEAALREAREETGLAVELHAPVDGTDSETARPLPSPMSMMLEDITIHENHVSHQHIDMIYAGRASARDIDPATDEHSSAEDWVWFSPRDLRTDDRIDADVREHALTAIHKVETSSSDSTSEETY